MNVFLPTDLKMEEKKQKKPKQFLEKPEYPGGKKDSALKRAQLLEYYGLPSRMPANQLVKILNCITTPQGLREAVQSMKKGENKCE